ncbi:MAG: PepSY domain-containing protein [Thermomonas sp.]
MPRCRLSSLKLLTIAILAMLPVLSAFAGPQSKQHARERDNSGSGQTEGYGQNGQQLRDRSLSDAVRRVERDTRGEVLSAERVQYDGRDMHRVKVVDDQGRVRVFMQDPSPRQDNSGATRGSGGRGNSRSSTQGNTPTRNDDD